MTCFNPKIVNFIPYTKIDEKTGQIYKTYKAVFGYNFMDNPTAYNMIPCGKCWGCRADIARDFSVRVYLETLKTGPNCFLTLTYDNEHLPNNKSVNKRDLQLFFKKLRKKGYKFRYLACGEYGLISKRPHAHVIMLGYFPKDAKKFKKNYYLSEEINKTWGKGFTLIAPVNINTITYVAQYCLKKSKIDYENFLAGREKEFLLTSRHPGLGYGILKQPLLSDTIPVVNTNKQIQYYRVPAFLKNKAKKEDRDLAFKIATEHFPAQREKTKKLLEGTDLNFGHYFKMLTERAKTKLKKFDKRIKVS